MEHPRTCPQKSNVYLHRRERQEQHGRKPMTPKDRRIFNSASNKLKTALHTLIKVKLHDIRLFFKQFGPLTMETDKIKKKAAPASSPIRKNTTPTGPWAKSDGDKVKLFASHLSEVYTPTLTPRPRSRKHARQPRKMPSQDTTVQSLRLIPSHQKTIPNQVPMTGTNYS